MSTLLLRMHSPPKQLLRTVQPTPSTTLFTVSTRPIPKTIAALAILYLSLLAKVLFGTLALGALWTRYSVGRGQGAWPLHWVLGEIGEARLVKLVERIQWQYLIPVAIATLWRVLQRGYTEESLLVLRGLGLQTSTSSPTYLTTAATRFIPTTSIQDIFIHEAFKGFEVRFYLAIVVKDEEDVVVVFPHLLPRREILEEVWRGAKACLYEGVGQKSKS